MQTGDSNILSTSTDSMKPGNEHNTANTIRLSISSINPDAKLKMTGPIEKQAKSSKLSLFWDFFVFS